MQHFSVYSSYSHTFSHVIFTKLWQSKTHYPHFIETESETYRLKSWQKMLMNAGTGTQGGFCCFQIPSSF